MHWLVGGGISTNETAAKILLAWMKKQPLPAGVRYFLVVVKCANHQANLAIGSAVSGKTALVGTRCAGRLGRTPLADRPASHSSQSAASQVCVGQSCGSSNTSFLIIIQTFAPTCRTWSSE